MSLLNFAVAHSELGITHFRTDLILVLSFAIVTALPLSLLRPQIQEENVKSNFSKAEAKYHMVNKYEYVINYMHKLIQINL